MTGCSRPAFPGWVAQTGQIDLRRGVRAGVEAVLSRDDDPVGDLRATDQRLPAIEPPSGGNSVPIGQLLTAGTIGVGDRYDTGMTVDRCQVSVRLAAVTRPDYRDAHRLCQTASLESPRKARRGHETS
jgi:hypothetical protein